MTAGLQPAAPHGATDPFGDRCGDRSLDDASAVVNVLVSRLVVGRVGAGSEGVEPPAGGFGDCDATVTRAQEEWTRMTWYASLAEKALAKRRVLRPYQRTTGLPVLARSRRPGCNSLWSREPG